MRDLPWNLRATTAPLGIAGRVSDAKQISDAGGIRLHICPATGNAPTRMTRASWDRLCAATQERSRERECTDKNQAQLMRMSRRLNVCAWCQGKILPRGLEFITKEELVAMTSQKREEEMAKQSRLGVCENCGEKSALTTSYGKRVCTTCLKIRSSVQNHVDKIAISARSLGKGEALLSALVPEGGGLAIKVTADLLQVISGLVGYTGEDPEELVAAVRKATALGAHQLTSEAEAGALRTIAGIVGYEGTDGEQLVEAVRKQVLACASCEAEDVLGEIREIVGYTPEQGDKGLADMVRQLVACPSVDCGKCTTLRGDLLRACGLEMDDTEDGDGWDMAAAAAIQAIAEIEYFYRREAARFLMVLEDEQRKLANLNERNRLLHNHVGLGESQLTKLRAELTLAQQSRDEWEQRAVQAEANVQDQAAELNADDTRLRDELASTGAEVERLRDRAQESESSLIWYREALAVLRDRLGLEHLGEDEDVVERMLEAIASQAQALTRFQEMARAADLRADEVEADIRTALQASESDEQTIDVAHRRMAVIKTLDRLYNAAEERATLLQDDLAQRDTIITNLREQLAATDQSSADSELWEPEPAPTVPTSTWGDESLLADFGRRVLRGEVAVSFLGVRP